MKKNIKIDIFSCECIMSDLPILEVRTKDELSDAIKNRLLFNIAEDFKFIVCNDGKNMLNFLGLNIENAKAIAHALEWTKAPLHILYLSCNNIGDEGAKAIAHALERTSAPLNDLNLSHNNIGDEGAKAIAYALEWTSAPLNELNLNGNNIGEEGAKAFVDALAKTSAPLNFLSLGENIGQEYFDQIKELLKTTKDNVVQTTYVKSAIN